MNNKRSEVIRKSLSTPAMRQKMRENALICWSDPAYRAKNLAAHQKATQDQSYKDLQRKLAKDRWSNEDFRTHIRNTRLPNGLSWAGAPFVDWPTTTIKFGITIKTATYTDNIVAKCDICDVGSVVKIKSLNRHIKRGYYRCFDCATKTAKKPKTKIYLSQRTKCSCGCGELANIGKRYIEGHHPKNAKYKQIELDYISKNGHPVCQCGCGNQSSFKRGKPNRFIAGHNNKIYNEQVSVDRSNAAKANWDQNRELLLQSIKKNAKMPKRFKNKSIINDAMEQYLCDLEIGYSREHLFDDYQRLFDFYLPEYEVVIENHGNYWHSLDNKIVRDNEKAKFLCMINKRLEVFWEHEFLSKTRILNRLNAITNKSLPVVPENFKFNDIEIKHVNWKDVSQFLHAYHYLGLSDKASWVYVALLQNKIVAVASFGMPTYLEVAKKQNFPPDVVRELKRFCIHPSYQKLNFGSWFLSRCVKQLHIDNNSIKILVSFADPTFGHDGTLYKASGWIFDGEEANPSYGYVDSDGNQYHKRTIYNHASKMKMAENEFVDQYSLYRIDTLPKLRFLYKYSP